MRKLSEIQTDYDKAMEDNRTDDGIRYALEYNKAVKKTEALLDEISFERLQEIALAEKAGNLIILPSIKEGQEIFMIYSGKIKKLKFTSWSVRRGVLSGHLFSVNGFNGVFYLDDLGKRAFLTEKAAEKALGEAEEA